jgi:hypothetical protein
VSGPQYVAECGNSIRHVVRGEGAFLRFGGPEMVDAAMDHHRELGHEVRVYRYEDDAEIPVLVMPRDEPAGDAA